MGNVYGKMILMLGWSGLVFYDEDDKTSVIRLALTQKKEFDI